MSFLHHQKKLITNGLLLRQQIQAKQGGLRPEYWDGGNSDVDLYIGDEIKNGCYIATTAKARV